jgi:hypothetical protein
MTLQNLSKILDKYDLKLGSSSLGQFELPKGLTFYHEWESSSVFRAKPAQIDFNHAIGLPQKNGIVYSLFNYEKLVFDTLQNYKHVRITSSLYR